MYFIYFDRYDNTSTLYLINIKMCYYLLLRLFVLFFYNFHKIKVILNVLLKIVLSNWFKYTFYDISTFQNLFNYVFNYMFIFTHERF